jgi:hypothetical protein
MSAKRLWWRQPLKGHPLGVGGVDLAADRYQQHRL